MSNPLTALRGPVLTYTGDAAPVLLLPPQLYAGSFPKAKVLVPTPHAAYRGELRQA